MSIIDLPKIRNKRDKIYPVDENRMKILNIKYIDFSDKIHEDGEIAVLDIAENEVRSIFEELYERKFPIFSLKNIEEFDYDDEKSMSANNSSAFNPRYISGTDMPSIHSYGLAIDVNPKQNPYIKVFSRDQGLLECHPKSGVDYLNRSNQRPGMVEPVIDIFIKHGFSIWGGKWNDVLDYHHFQTSRLTANLLANLPFNKAKEYFEFYKENFSLLNKLDENLEKSQVRELESYIIVNSEKFLSDLQSANLNIIKLSELLA